MKTALTKLLVWLVIGVTTGVTILFGFTIYYYGNVAWLYLVVFAISVLLIATAALIFLRASALSKMQSQLTSEDLIEREKSQFDSIFNYDMNGIALLGLDGKCLRVNKVFCELLGYDINEVLTLNYDHFIDKEDFLNIQENVQKLLDNKIQTYKKDIQCLKKNNESMLATINLSLIRDAEQLPQIFILQLQNKLSQRQAEDKLHHMAYHDALTGLDNRNKLEQNLNQIVASAKRSNASFAILFLDIDKFKYINDKEGHEAGDVFLQIMAERLRAAVRNTDMVARVGGDEFVVLIHDVKKSESVAGVAIKILESVSQPVIISGMEVNATTSIGISLYPHDGHSIHELLSNADTALYRAKEQGRNCYQFYTIEMTYKSQEKISLMHAIENALIRDEFELYYQPQMNLKTRQITCVEALLRWRNPDYKMIMPAEIISISEESGLITDVSKWILSTGCKQLVEWHNMGMGQMQLAINLTGRPFKQPDFTDNMLSILQEVGLSPAFLNIEVTEATILQNPEELIKNLYLLKDLGVGIVIDDFGIGYWSLNNLRRLSVNKIKIDNSFIQQITEDRMSRSITAAIIAMADKLGITSVAEGVESRLQYEYLKNEGCCEIQGYYLIQPMSAQAITKFLKHPIPAAEQISIRDVT